MANKKSTLVYRTDLVNVGIGQGQKQSVPYLSSMTEFDSNGRVIANSSYSPEGILLEKIETGYDEDGRVIRESYYVEEDVPTEEKSYEYNNEGKLEREVKHYADGSSDITSYRYDSAGILIEKITADDEEEVDAVEKFEYRDNKLTRHEITDAEGNPLLLEEFDYDGKGNLISHIRDDEEAGEYYKMLIKYNEEGQKIAELLHNDEDELVETTWFEMDEKGRIVQSVEESSFSRKVKNFSFDDRGNALGYEETDGKGDKVVVIEHIYDPANNPVSSMVFVNGSGRSAGQHYELRYEYEWYGQARDEWVQEL